MAYDTIKIYGGGDINYVMCTTLALSDNDIETLKSAGLQSPEWTDNTIMLANFREDTNGSCYTISNDVVGYRIQRYEADYDRLRSIVYIEGEYSYFEDYCIRNNRTYQYRIVPVYSKNGEKFLGAPITTDVVSTDWCGWSLIGTTPAKKKGVYTVDYDNIWNLTLNVKPSDIRYMQNKELHIGFGKYPKEVQGQGDYIEGNLSCLIGNLQCENYEGDTIDFVKKWQSFCNNGQLKLLRDPKGFIIPCSIKDTSHAIDYAVLEQATTISFSFTQLADESDIVVYGLGV